MILLSIHCLNENHLISLYILKVKINYSEFFLNNVWLLILFEIFDNGSLSYADKVKLNKRNTKSIPEL